MNFKEYYKLPDKFQKAFERENGELPRGEHSEHVRAVWLNMAATWFNGWQLAIEHASELRPPMPPLPEPAPVRTRHILLTLEPDGSFTAHETKLPGNLQTEPMQVTTHEAGRKNLRDYQGPQAPQSEAMREYVSSLEDSKSVKPWLEQEPPFPVPPPSLPVPRQGHAPAAPITAAEAAAASVESVEPRKFIIINASSDSSNSWRWLVEVEEKELVKIGSYPNREDANAALNEIEGAELMGSIYAISDARLKFWQQNPNLLYVAREVFTGPAPHTK